MDTSPQSPFLINTEVSDLFEQLASYYQYTGDSIRSNTYSNAAVIIRTHPQPIGSGEELRHYRGIGSSIIEDINQYLATGTMTRVELLRHTYPDLLDVVDKFYHTYHIAPKKAVELYKMGIRTVDAALTSGYLSSREIAIVKWAPQLNRLIKREEMDKIQMELDALLRVYNVRWLLGGSYRRLALTSGDIDLLIAAPPDRPDINMDAVLLLLLPHLYFTFSKGTTKFSGIYLSSEHSVGHHIDINLVTEHNDNMMSTWWYSVLHTTGSARFNRLMRVRALSMGLKLNQYGLYNSDGDTYLVQSEREIFQLLSVKYIPPEGRSNNVELELE